MVQPRDMQPTSRESGEAKRSHRESDAHSSRFGSISQRLLNRTENSTTTGEIPQDRQQQKNDVTEPDTSTRHYRRLIQRLWKIPQRQMEKAKDSATSSDLSSVVKPKEISSKEQQEKKTRAHVESYFKQIFPQETTDEIFYDLFEMEEPLPNGQHGLSDSYLSSIKSIKDALRGPLTNLAQSELEINARKSRELATNQTDDFQELRTNLTDSGDEINRQDFRTMAIGKILADMDKTILPSAIDSEEQDKKDFRVMATDEILTDMYRTTILLEREEKQKQRHNEALASLEMEIAVLKSEREPDGWVLHRKEHKKLLRDFLQKSKKKYTEGYPHVKNTLEGHVHDSLVRLFGSSDESVDTLQEPLTELFRAERAKDRLQKQIENANKPDEENRSPIHSDSMDLIWEQVQRVHRNALMSFKDKVENVLDDIRNKTIETASYPPERQMGLDSEKAIRDRKIREIQKKRLNDLLEEKKSIYTKYYGQHDSMD